MSSTGDDNLQQAHLDFMAQLSVASSASSVPTHKAQMKTRSYQCEQIMKQPRVTTYLNRIHS